ncbi:MAG: hypothetical protein GY822_21595 [Deltaproteobacteria bacterium]|nr:hypothetical protein [Deltaproteobacteria bacterium]
MFLGFSFSQSSYQKMSSQVLLVVSLILGASTGFSKEPEDAPEASATSKEKKSAVDEENENEEDSLWAFELLYSETALTPVSGSATEHWRLPSFRLSGLMPVEVSDFSLWVGGDVQLGGFLQFYGSSSAGSVFLGPFLRVRTLIGSRWETPFVDVIPYVFVAGSSAIAMGSLIVGNKLTGRLQLPVGSEFGGGLWWNMSGFLLRLDLGMGFFDTRLAVSLSGGLGVAF